MRNLTPKLHILFHVSIGFIVSLNEQDLFRETKNIGDGNRLIGFKIKA